MKLVDDWRAIVTKAWSMKFMALSVVFTTLEVLIGIVKPEGVPNVLFAVLAGLVGLGAMVARVFAQKELQPGASNEPTK